MQMQRIVDYCDQEHAKIEELFQQIPDTLYLAVAKVLAYLHQLKLYNSGLASPPVPLTDLPIPQNLQHD